jgi:uncharacterized protein (DUF1501 family)
MSATRTSSSAHGLTRRSALTLGLSVSLLGGAAFAGTALGRRKLVVIVCRGAMDGLSLAPPIGDANYAVLRGPIAIPADKAIKLDDTFALHPKLVNLAKMMQAGQARIAPAAAIPERIRSHFEAQDLLETGGGRLYAVTTGWLNRALQAAQPGRPLKAISIGAQEPLILRGAVEAESWSPGGRMSGESGRVASVLQDLYADDALLGPALASGLNTEAMAETLNGAQQIKPADVSAVAGAAARFLTAEGGPQIAVLSLDGFDTHANQGAADGQLANRLGLLDQVVGGLQSGLGPSWSDTVVLAATEFGRTARINGTGGTDHGTASALVLAGGALKSGGIVGDWPTLADDKLFENRDLAPTLDIRAVFKGVLTDHLGLERRALDAAVFPDSAQARPVSGLVSA